MATIPCWDPGIRRRDFSEKPLPSKQERAMSFVNNMTRYVEIAIIGVLALAALAGIIRFIVLANIF